MKWGMILFRGSALPVTVLIGAVVTAAAFWRAAATSPGLLSEFGKFGDYIFYGGGLWAFALVIRFAWHLRSWETGATDPCEGCDGPLGKLRPGKVYYGRQLGEYRSCYNCHKANAAS